MVVIQPLKRSPACFMMAGERLAYENSFFETTRITHKQGLNRIGFIIPGECLTHDNSFETDVYVPGTFRRAGHMNDFIFGKS
jgi:hypothetical protein